jgi:hypothetical protein
MSIVNNALVTGLTGADGAAYQPPGSAAFGEAAPAAASDSIAFGPGYGWNGGGGAFGGGLYGGSSSGSTGLGGYGGIMNGFMNMLASALGSLSSMFGFSSVSSPWSGIGGGGSGSVSGSSGYGAPQQTFFSNATAHSTGDPHDGFSGTTGNGTNLSESWNDMNARPDLLRSDSFAGGYRVSTTSTTPEANGVTYNASATVSTDGGRTNVTMNAGGSYSVTENGQNVTLTQGRAVSLDGTETVTLNANGSLTVNEANDRGGSLSTTLASNGSGVDVNASASNVDLGGYLVGRTEAAGNPSPIQPFSAAANPLGTSLAANPFGTYTAQTSSPFSSVGDVAQLLESDAQL